MFTTTSPAEPQFAMAGLFLGKLAAADFDQLAVALEPDAKLSALLPRGLREWEGREAVCGAFATLFGGMDEYVVLDATVGLIGTRLQLSWRLHVRGGRWDRRTSSWSRRVTRMPVRPAASSASAWCARASARSTPMPDTVDVRAWGDWDQDTRNDPYPLFDQMRSQCPVQPVRLADGHDAWLVVGYDAARQALKALLALKDARLSKDMVSAMDADPEVVPQQLKHPTKEHVS